MAKRGRPPKAKPNETENDLKPIAEKAASESENKMPEATETLGVESVPGKYRKFFKGE